jgi:hypothetical protein
MAKCTRVSHVFCAYCGKNMIVPTRRVRNGVKTCGTKCAVEYRKHVQYGRTIEERRNMVLEAAEKTKALDGSVRYAEIAAVLGWPKHRVRHQVHALRRDGLWEYTYNPKNTDDVIWLRCHRCKMPFVPKKHDRAKRLKRGRYFCSLRCSNLSAWDARRSRAANPVENGGQTCDSASATQRCTGR